MGRVHETTKISFGDGDDSLLGVYRHVYSAVDGFISSRLAGNGKLFFGERVFSRADADDFFLYVRGEYGAFRSIERQIRAATDFNFRRGTLYGGIIFLRGLVEHLFFAGGQIFSSGRFGRSHHSSDGSD